MDISIKHSTAISCVADRLELEARRGRVVSNTFHYLSPYSCIHLGAAICPPERAAVLEPITQSRRLWRTPFGFCDARELAAELNLRRALALERLAHARSRGFDVPYLHVWENPS